MKPHTFTNFVKEQGTAIHINIDWKDRKVIRDPQPFLESETINVVLDNNIAKSPIFENNQFVIWEDDLANPSFINALIKRINKLSCDEKQEL